jgi:hypothetical protein
MSLINDALKRASQAEKNRPRDDDLPAAMQAVPAARRSLLPVVTSVAAVALLAVGGWLMWISFAHRASLASPAIPTPPKPVAASSLRPDPPPPLPSASVAKEVAPPVAPPPTPKPETAPVAVTVAPPVKTNPPALPVAAPAALSTTPPPFPELKLQGIFYSSTNPRAIINGQIHVQNDLVGEVRLVTISRNKVTVEWNGQTKDLNLEGQ